MVLSNFYGFFPTVFRCHRLNSSHLYKCYWPATSFSLEPQYGHINQLGSIFFLQNPQVFATSTFLINWLPQYEQLFHFGSKTFWHFSNPSILLKFPQVTEMIRHCRLSLSLMPLYSGR